MTLYQLIKPLLFKLQPETAHQFTVDQLSILRRLPLLSGLTRQMWKYESPNLVTQKMGLTFKNPVGLAAGFDKNGAYVDAMEMLGFGFIEVGTVTPRGQAGNDRPRLFRLPKDEALINRMGFNNEGVEVLIDNLRKVKSGNLIIGGNIGKNKVTPNEHAMDDYLLCFRKLFDHVDYFVVNVSSPNTPGLRNLQEREPLAELLGVLQAENQIQPKPKPILLKIAPDLNFFQLDDVLTVVWEKELAGIIATNTTLDRTGLKTSAVELTRIGAGGLSGAPLRSRADDIIAHIRKHSPPEFTIIGVGGIMNPDNALRKLDHGADLIQIYTGLIYAGPTLVRQINRALSQSRS